MLKTTLTVLLVSVLLIVSQACAPLSRPTPDVNSINTAIAQTLVAGSTQASPPGIPITGPSATPTPQVAAATSTATLSPTPIFTATSAAAQISVSLATNCRTGPSIAYDRVSALLVGQVAQVVGRNAAGNYWLIRDPDNPTGVCWLWGQYASVTGNTAALPVVTPPPLPTPSATPTAIVLPSATPITATFTAAYNGKESCVDGGWWVDIQLGNSSGMTFQSITMTVRDVTANTTVPLSADGFTSKNGCNPADTRDNLAPGATVLVSSPAFTYDPSGHELSATITLCSDRGQKGTCLTQTINFMP